MENNFLTKEQIQLLLDELRKNENVYKLIVFEEKESNRVIITICRINLMLLYKAKKEIMEGNDINFYETYVDYMSEDIEVRENKLIIANSSISTQSTFPLFDYTTNSIFCLNKAFNNFLRNIFNNAYLQILKNKENETR